MRRRHPLSWMIAATALSLIAAACSSSKSGSSSYTMTGVHTTLSLGEAVSKSFQTDGVTVAAVPPATANPSGGIDFPIIGGTVDKGTFHGTVKHKGGLRFSAPGGKTMTFSDPIIDTTTGLF